MDLIDGYIPVNRKLTNSKSPPSHAEKGPAAAAAPLNRWNQCRGRIVRSFDLKCPPVLVIFILIRRSRLCSADGRKVAVPDEKLVAFSHRPSRINCNSRERQELTHQIVFQRITGNFRITLKFHLFDYTCAIGAYGLYAEVNRLADLLTALPAGDQAHDFEFPI